MRQQFWLVPLFCHKHWGQSDTILKHIIGEIEHMYKNNVHNLMYINQLQQLGNQLRPLSKS